MTTGDITSITLSTDDQSVTVSKDTFDRYVKGIKTMSSATATRPAIHVRVPTEDDFGGADFMPAPELTALYDQLILDYPETHGHLQWVDVKVVWKRKAGKKHGRQQLGYCAKTSGLARYFSEAEFVIWIGADSCLDGELTDSQIRAAVSHEMRHIGWEEGEDGEAGKAVIVGHDADLFFSEIKELGAWQDFIGEAAEAFSQAGLF